MWSDDVRVLGDIRSAAWVARRLGEASTPQCVGDVVPSGFAAYARVLHPVQAADGTVASWAEVAERSGRPLGATTRWADLAAGGPGPEPARGTLPVEQLAALCDLLDVHTTVDECTFALWEGWPGWEPPVPGSPGGAGWPPDLSQVPRVRFAGRDHVLLAGPLSAVLPMSYHDEPGQWWAQSPTAFWPDDRGWCVVTDPSGQCTFVGGSVALAEDVLAAADLEAWPVRPSDRLVA